MNLLRKPPSLPRLCIVGDHSKFHAGCKAVMQTLWRLASEKGWRIVKEGEDYEALLVNGEGSMHDGSKQFHRKMHS